MDSKQTESPAVPEAFEKGADKYGDEVQKSISFLGTKHDFFTQTKAEHLLSVAARNLGDLSSLKLLDVGCGVGLMDRYLVSEVAGLEGVDPQRGSIEQACQNVPDANYRVADGTELPFEDGSFDLTFTVCVMHHVPPTEWRAFMKEMKRVTRPSGLVVVFEHNTLNPLTRLAVFRCSFDEGAVLLGRRKVTRLMRQEDLDIAEAPYITVFPFSGKIWSKLDRMLSPLPLGAQYYVAGRKPLD